MANPLEDRTDCILASIKALPKRKGNLSNPYYVEICCGCLNESPHKAVGKYSTKSFALQVQEAPQ